MTRLMPAPPLEVSEWLNSQHGISLSGLQGRVVMICAFQMLCPACVELGLPQAKRVRALFAEQDLVVLGLHTLFEHHSAVTKATLEAFLYENRIRFPVGLDRPGENSPIPKTMQTYNLQGTPTTILISKQGLITRQHLGHIPDLQLGSEIMALIAED